MTGTIEERIADALRSDPYDAGAQRNAHELLLYLEVTSTTISPINLIQLVEVAYGEDRSCVDEVYDYVVPRLDDAGRSKYFELLVTSGPYFFIWLRHNSASEHIDDVFGEFVERAGALDLAACLKYVGGYLSANQRRSLAEAIAGF